MPSVDILARCLLPVAAAAAAAVSGGWPLARWSLDAGASEPETQPPAQPPRNAVSAAGPSEPSEPRGRLRQASRAEPRRVPNSLLTALSLFRELVARRGFGVGPPADAMRRRKVEVSSGETDRGRPWLRGCGRVTAVLGVAASPPAPRVSPRKRALPAKLKLKSGLL